MSSNKAKRLALWIPLIVFLAVAVNFWSLNSAHYFYADDWGWLERVTFGSWKDLVRVFPSGIYNDRPAGEAFIFLAYSFFGLNSHFYNVLWLVLHVLNSVIFFLIARKFLSPTRAVLAAALAATWYSTLTAVHWVGAIFDLAGATWCLLCLLFYVRASESDRPWGWQAALAVLMHVLAIRCKEFAIVLVIVLATWDLLLIEGHSVRRRLVRLAPHILLTVAYGAIYLLLFLKRPDFVSAGTYKISLSFSSVIDNAGYYFAKAFYIKDAWNRQGGYLVMVLVMALSLTSKRAFAGLIAAGSLMAAVLVMPNQQNALYLYAPHFFLSFTICAVGAENWRINSLIIGSVVALILYPFSSHYWAWNRNFYIENGKYSERLALDYAEAMAGKPSPHRLSVAVSRTYFDPFSWGGGAFFRIYHRDASIKAEVVKLSDPQVEFCKSTDDACFGEVNGRLVRLK